MNRIALALLASLLGLPANGQEGHLNETVASLVSGKTTFGLFAADLSPVNAQALATSDLDFVLIDMEHGPFDVGKLHAFLMAMTNKARIAEKGNVQMDVTPLVRIPTYGRENLPHLVKQVLDVGAFGVVFPFIETKEQAEAAVASMRYPPQSGESDLPPRGIRGASPFFATWVWGTTPLDYVRRADVWPLDRSGDLLAVIQIESKQGLDNVEEIAAVGGVGAIFVGPFDLSLSLGIIGQNDHPDMRAAIARALAPCRRHDVPCGITADPRSIEASVDQGFRFLTVGYWDDAGISSEPADALRRGRKAAAR